MLNNPAVTSPIIGATKPHHIDDAVAATELDLNVEEIKLIEDSYVPHPIMGFS